MMQNSSLLLAVTLGLLAVFVTIVVRVYSRGRAKEVERPKYRMLEDE